MGESLAGSLPADRRDPKSRLKLIIVGAGLGGLGAAIGLAQAGHEVEVLEAARDISEIGAGIQVLPNSSRVLCSWGISDELAKCATATRVCNILGWKGNHISSMDFASASEEYGSPFWDFHRADLHQILLKRALALGAKLHVRSEVVDMQFDEEKSKVTVSVKDQGDREADMVIGADGINSRCREILLGRREPPKRTGDLAYRLLLHAKDVMADPDLRPYIEDKVVNYWYGPDAHVVTYALREGTLLNMVLLVPDDMPEDGPSTLAGSVDEMQGLFKDWDPKIGKLLALCKSVARWRLCIRESIDTWVHPSACFVLLGDAAHATLPYLASGAGMCFEDASVLGEVLSRVSSTSVEEKKKALAVYELCRKDRTETVVERGTLQQDLNHLHDGREQSERDEKMRAFEAIETEWQKGIRRSLPADLKDGDDPLVWRRFGVGDWLLRYDCAQDVEDRWSS